MRKFPELESGKTFCIFLFVTLSKYSKLFQIANWTALPVRTGPCRCFAAAGASVSWPRALHHKTMVGAVGDEARIGLMYKPYIKITHKIYYCCF